MITQFKQTPLEDEYNTMQPTYVNTLPGTTSMVTPIAKSTPVTQASQMPTLPIVSPSEKDILEPSSNEQAKAAYLERQMQGMSSVRLPSDMPSLQDMLLGSENLPKRIQNFCQEQKDKRKYEWESLKVALEKMKESKEKRQSTNPRRKRCCICPNVTKSREN